MKNKEKINILQVIGGLNMGGAETFLVNILKSIDRDRFQMYFLCYGNEHFDYEDVVTSLGGKILRVHKPKHFFDFGLIGEIRQIIKDNNIDVIHAHTYYNSMYAVIAAHQMHIKKIIVHSHNTKPAFTKNIVKKAYYIFSKKIINKYGNIFLACGEDAGKSLFDKKNTYEVIDNGILIGNFKYSEEARKEIRKELGIADDIMAFVNIGRFERQKNHSYLLDIFKAYYDKNHNVKLFLIGDGTLKNEILNKINKMGIGKNVVLLGKRSDVNKILSAMDVFLFPSLYEGLPVSLIEAQANGIPIIASETIDNDVDFTGTIRFAPLNDSRSWVKLIEESATCRTDNTRTVSNSKYNARNSAIKLEKIYGRDDMGAKVSVIIPAYNSEKYIDECIRSVLNQTYENIEIIVVDDESQDDTLAIVKNIARFDDRVRVYSKKNGGPGAARAFGVIKSSGKYIMFLDSDDTLELLAVEKVVDCFRKKDVDIVRFGVMGFPRSKKIQEIKKSGLLSREEVLEYLLMSDKFSSMWIQAYKNECFGNVDFVTNIGYCEDYLTNQKIHASERKVFAVNDVLYNYRINPQSITKTKNRKQLYNNLNDRIYSCVKTVEFINSVKLDDKIKYKALGFQIDRVRPDLFKFINSYSDNNDAKQSVKDIYNSTNLRELINSVEPLHIKCYLKSVDLIKRLRVGKIINSIYNEDVESILKHARIYQNIRMFGKRKNEKR